MTQLVRATDLIGRPVVTIDGGDDVAEVRDVVCDADARRLVGFTNLGTVNGLVLMVGAQVDVVGHEFAERSGGRSLIPIDAPTSVSGDSLVVPARVAEFMRQDLSDSGGAVEQHRMLHEGDR